jgi:hypothetical protein
MFVKLQNHQKKSKEKKKAVLGGSHFFVKNRRFQFWGQVLRITSV